MINNYKRIVAGILLACAPCVPQANPRGLIIEDVVLIDGTGRGAINQVSVLVQGDRIRTVKKGKFTGFQRDAAQIINGEGKYLIPGLIDVHVHLTGSVKVTKDGLRKVNIDQKKGVRALHGYLYSGVTSIYDSGNIPDYIFALRDQERTGKIHSPRIFATGGIVTYPGSHGSGPGATLVNGWPGAIPLLERHMKHQPDILKLTLEERGWGARPLVPKLPLPLMKNIIEYYNDRGIRTTAHIASELRARQAIFVGIDALSHPVITGPITEEFTRLMATKKIPMATTLTIGENYSRLVEHPEYLNQALYQAVLTQEEIHQLKNKTRERYKIMTWTWWMKIMTPIAQENIRQLNAAGAVMALGTDQSSGPAAHREMELLVAAGIPELEVMTIATLNGAKFLGKEGDLGSVTEGKLADMVLLNSNPLVDIRNVKSINTVIKNGKIIEREQLSLPINEN